MKYKEKKWKPPYWLYILLIAAGIYLALVMASAYSPGDSIYSLIPKLTDAFAHLPYVDVRAALHQPKAFAIAAFFTELAVFIYIMYDVSKIRDFMPGKEYGTAEWAAAAEISKKFADTEKIGAGRKKADRYTNANRVYSDGLRIYMDGDKTRINNNVLAIGGSGVGKSMFFLTPNIYQADKNSKFPGSYIFTDPKGELLLKNGAYLKDKGYHIKVLNLVPGKMSESDRFNPFPYIRTEADVIKLITNLQKNTNTGKNTGSQDPFWDKAEALYLKALFLLVWMEHDRFGLEMNMNSVISLMHECEITEDHTSKLDKKFEQLVNDTADIPGQGEEHPAYIAYKEAMGGAEDTVRSIKITADARMAIFDNDEIKRVLSGDDIDLAAIGTGIYGEKKDERTALFCVIPDSDTTYNCVAGMMYTLLFQELYYQADFNYNGKLPVPVTFWLDEFANIALPDDFLKMLSTMRSRLISCVIIIQNLAQIKAMWEKEWEQIPGNCDVSVYLGGNEQSTFEYVSKNLGKKTIHKKSRGEQLGHNRSSSNNTDTVGRELMLPEEVRELDNDYCVIFVRGMKPVLDRKFRTFDSPEYKKSQELGLYVHSEAREADKALRIEEISCEEAEAFADEIIDINLDRGLEENVELDELAAIAVKNKEEEEEELASIREVDITGWSLEEVLSHPDFSLSDEEMREVQAGMDAGLTDEEIKSYILYEDTGRMRAQRLAIMLAKRRGAV